MTHFVHLTNADFVYKIMCGFAPKTPDVLISHLLKSRNIQQRVASH